VAAVLYVFRTLVDDEIPLNAGCLKPLEIIVPEGSMLNPNPPAAVVAGNVETSTCVTNALYGALESWPRPMHHEQFHLRERALSVLRDHRRRLGRGVRICGHERGADAHDQLTLTDPEVLEFRFPVRLDSFEIRLGRAARALARRRRRRAARAISRAHERLDFEQ